MLVVNRAASIRQRLLNLSRERHEAFDFVLQQYVIQRLLYRLSVSQYCDQYLLKGAMLFLVWTGELHRPTKDIDLLGFGENDVDTLVADFKTICRMTIDDGLMFDAASIQGTQFREDEPYHGVRLNGFAYLEQAKIRLQIDVGFGDAVTPNPEMAVIPSFLEMPDAVIRIYAVYSVIAEKFQAMVTLGIANSRMKDFYDVWVIAANWDLDGVLLVDAVKATFQRRETAVSGEPLIVFHEEFMNDVNKEKQWEAFHNKNRLTSAYSFQTLMYLLEQFLAPVYHAAGLTHSYTYEWDASGWQWVRKSSGGLSV